MSRSSARDKDDGKVPCPYCQKKYEPLSMHQYACPLKPSDENIVENATKRVSFSDAESDKSQDTEIDGTLLSPFDEEELKEIMDVLSGLSFKNQGWSYESNTKDKDANDRGMSHRLKTYDEEAYKIATKDLTWIDSPDSSGNEYEREHSSSEDTDEDWGHERYVIRKDPKYQGPIIKEEETEYCLEKINALMSNLLQKLNDRTQLSWVKMNSGSHYSNVKLPNEMEFDYMLCPTQVQCRIEPSSDHHCYCRVFITNKLKLPLEFQEILGPHDELTPSKFKEYVFGILDKIRPQNQLLSRVENKTMCPAYTVDYKIGRTNLNQQLCIDWVPCLEVQEPPNYCTEWKTRLLTEEEKKACPLYVVAKNFEDDGEELELWRLSYSVFELKILRDKCTEEDRNVVKVLKHIMKLVTKENNKNNYTIRMCSYHVMSQCLRYFEDTPQRPVGKNHLLDMIAYLIIAVHSKDIRHFFIPSFNLMHDVENEEIEQFNLRFYYYKKELRKYKPGRLITPIIRLCGQLGLITVKKP